MPHLAPIPQLKFQRGITTGDSSSAQLIYPSLPKLATGRPASDPEGKSDPGTNAASSTLRFTARSIASRDKDTCSLNIAIGDSGSPLRPRPDSAHCPWSLWHRLPLGVILHFSCLPMKAIAGDQVTLLFPNKLTHSLLRLFWGTQHDLVYRLEGSPEPFEQYVPNWGKDLGKEGKTWKVIKKITFQTNTFVSSVPSFRSD